MKDFTDAHVDKLLNQLETMDEQFKFYTKEAEHLDDLSVEVDYMNISHEEKTERQVKLDKQILELFTRYKKDSEYFDKLLVEIDGYFLKKFNINFNLRDLINGLEKS
jgi:hypothetical protein